jgi:hypothetical protein
MSVSERLPVVVDAALDEDRRREFHLTDRMDQRDITWDELAYALAWPDVTYPSRQSPDRTIILSTLPSGRQLRVVVLTEDTDKVVTVMDRGVWS